MHVWRSVKSVRRAKRTYTTLKEFRGCERGFTQHRTRGYGSFSGRLASSPGPSQIKSGRGLGMRLQDDHELYLLRWALLVSLIIIVLDTDFMALWLHLLALCLLFPFCARLLALSFSLPSPFCRRNNETASAATALRTINLRKCTQIFVNRIF